MTHTLPLWSESQLTAEDFELLNRKCSCFVSSDITGSVTRGTGKLSPMGYWQLECTHSEDNRSQIEG